VTVARNRTAIFWSFAAIYVIWGSTYLAIKIGIETIPPFSLAAIRFLIAGGMLYAWARWQGEPIPGRGGWGTAALLGTLFFVFGNGLVVWAEQHVPSGRTALLASTSPIWTVLLESALDRWRRPPGRVVAGIGCGMVGLALLASPNVGEQGGAVSLLGVLALVGASLAWAAGSVFAHRHHLPASPAMATGMKMIGGGAQLAVLALVTGEHRHLSVGQVSAGSGLALGYLIVFGSIIGFTAFTYLLRVTTPAVVGTSAYVNPLVAVGLGWALAGEAVTAKMMLGAGVSLFGVLLIRWPTRPLPPPMDSEVGTFETGEFPVPPR
jgi:drug/metabolite transporter (DMT)-like permease